MSIAITGGGSFVPVITSSPPVGSAGVLQPSGFAILVSAFPTAVQQFQCLHGLLDAVEVRAAVLAELMASGALMEMAHTGVAIERVPSAAISVLQLQADVEEILEHLGAGEPAALVAGVAEKYVAAASESISQTGETDDVGERRGSQEGAALSGKTEEC